MPSDDVVEFGGWPRPPRWVWAAAGVAVLAVLAGSIAAHTGSHHTAASSPPGPPPAAPSPAGHCTPAEPSWPSSMGACGSAVYLPQLHLSGLPANVLSGLQGHLHARLLVGGTGLRQVTLDGAVSGPLPGLPGRDRLVTSVVAGPGAA